MKIRYLYVHIAYFVMCFVVTVLLYIDSFLFIVDLIHLLFSVRLLPDVIIL